MSARVETLDPKLRQPFWLKPLTHKSFSGPRKYIRVSESVYDTCYLYLCSLAPSSQTHSNWRNFMRKAAGGIRLVTKKLVAPWMLKPEHAELLSLAVHVSVMQDAWANSEIIGALTRSRPKGLASLNESASVQVDRVVSWASLSVVWSLVEHLTTEGILCDCATSSSCQTTRGARSSHTTLVGLVVRLRARSPTNPTPPTSSHARAESCWPVLRRERAKWVQISVLS